MDCAKALVFMCPEIDDELTVADSAILQEHISVCSSCNDEWEALLVVDRSVKAVVDKVEIPAGLQDRVLAAVLKEQNERAGAGRNARFWGFASVAVAACFCLCLLSPNFISQKVASAEALVNETADGSPKVSHKNFKHIDNFELASKSGNSNLLALISRANMKQIVGLNMAAIDEYEDSAGTKVLRACFQSSTDKSFCVDCYFAPSGYLSIARSQEVRIAGKVARFGKAGNHNVVILSENGADYVYASQLEKGKLIALISKRS